MAAFVWTSRNVAHIAEHGRYIQVIYVFAVHAADLECDEVDLTLFDDPDLFYVIHAMPLDRARKRSFRRRRR